MSANAWSGSSGQVKKTTKRHNRKDRMIWIPRRCERPNCTAPAGAPLKKCSRCTCVLYCSKECQIGDYARHGVECKHLASLECWGCVFDPQKEREKYPTGGTLRVDLEQADKCGICGSTSTPLTRTDCCGNLVCDNQHEYQMFSYSRQFCGRSHDRYTLCGYHHGERHEGDWRDCERCAGSYDAGTMIWNCTNGYNFTAKEPPKGCLHTIECGACHGRIHSGHEGFQSGLENGVRMVKCEKCYGRM